MKTFKVILIMIAFSTQLQSQTVVTGQITVGDVPLSSIKSKYLQLVFTGKMLSSKATVEVDYGQATNLSEWDSQLRNEKGERVLFNSTIDGLNFMDSQGWDYVSQFVVTNGNQNVYHFILKRRQN